MNLTAQSLSLVDELQELSQRLKSARGPRAALILTNQIDRLSRSLEEAVVTGRGVSDVAAKDGEPPVPASAADCNIRASLLRRSGRTEEALTCLRVAAERSIGSFADYYNCSVEANRLGDQQLRLALARKALDLRPTDVNALVNYADTLSKLGEADEAGGKFRQALLSDAENCQANSLYVDHLFRHSLVEEGRRRLAEMQIRASSSLEAARYFLTDLRSHRRELGIENDAFVVELSTLADTLASVEVHSEEQKKQKARLHAVIASDLSELREPVAAARNYVRAVDLGLDDGVALSNLASDLRMSWAVPNLSLRVRHLALVEEPASEAIWQQMFERLSSDERFAAENGPSDDGNPRWSPAARVAQRAPRSVAGRREESNSR